MESGTGLGRTISAAGRPSAVLSAGATGPDNLVKAGPIVAPRIGNPWTWDDAHQPSAWFPQYILTGEPWYLDELYAWAGITVFEDAPADFRGPNGTYGGLWGYKAARAVAWTLRGRAEAAFAAPDGTPEKSYFTYMTNDAICQMGGRPEDHRHAFRRQRREALGGEIGRSVDREPAQPGQRPAVTAGQSGEHLRSGRLCAVVRLPSGDTNRMGIESGRERQPRRPLDELHLEYAVGRTAELGFAMRPIQLQLGQLPIGIIASSQPWMLGAYTMGAERRGGGFWANWEDLIANGMNPTYLVALKSQWAGGRQTWVTPGLAMLVDAGAPGATAAWDWYKTNAYSLTPASYFARDPRWAIVPRTDANVLPPHADGDTLTQQAAGPRQMLRPREPVLVDLVRCRSNKGCCRRPEH